eukprot:TRINITY_DN37601_c0_g1_i1.p1 TRINITY_DN37601_c0_g1~~TRINITY_DN37601_c0_g1_i1.p1  ORF type:complete len:462 (+),score=78.04 TRINITY_DN37601_c0_g1_i1:65-1450(+)
MASDSVMLMSDLAMSLESISETLLDLKHRVENIEHVQNRQDRHLEDQIRQTFQGSIANDLKEQIKTACTVELQAELEHVLSVELKRILTEFEEQVRMSENTNEDSMPELNHELFAVKEEEVEDATEAMDANEFAEDAAGFVRPSSQSHASQGAETPDTEGRQRIEMATHDPVGNDVFPSDPHRDVTALVSPTLQSRHVPSPQLSGNSSTTPEGGRPAPGIFSIGASFEPFEPASGVAEAGEAKGPTDAPASFSNRASDCSLPSTESSSSAFQPEAINLSDSGAYRTENKVVRRRSSSVPSLRDLKSRVDVAFEPQSRLPSQKDTSAWHVSAAPSSLWQSPVPAWLASPAMVNRHIRIPTQVISMASPNTPRSSLSAPNLSHAPSQQVGSPNPDFRVQRYPMAMPFANSGAPQLVQVGNFRHNGSFRPGLGLSASQPQVQSLTSNRAGFVVATDSAVDTVSF